MRIIEYGLNRALLVIPLSKIVDHCDGKCAFYINVSLCNRWMITEISRSVGDCTTRFTLFRERNAWNGN